MFVLEVFNRSHQAGRHVFQLPSLPPIWEGLKSQVLPLSHWLFLLWFPLPPGILFTAIGRFRIGEVWLRFQNKYIFQPLCLSALPAMSHSDHHCHFHLPLPEPIFCSTPFSRLVCSAGGFTPRPCWLSRFRMPPPSPMPAPLPASSSRSALELFQFWFVEGCLSLLSAFQLVYPGTWHGGVGECPPPASTSLLCLPGWGRPPPALVSTSTRLTWGLFRPSISTVFKQIKLGEGQEQEGVEQGGVKGE